LDSIIYLEAYWDQLIWTSCTSLICFAIIEWHQSDKVKLQFRLSQDIPEQLNNLDHLHKLDMKGIQDENWVTRHAQWIEVWKNRSELTLNGLPMLGPLVHTSKYMSWYISNSCLFLSVQQMLNDPRMHRDTTSTYVPPLAYVNRHELNNAQPSHPDPPRPKERRRKPTRNKH